MSRGAKHEILVRELLVALSRTGVCRVWQQPTGMAFRNDVAIRYGVIGSADISGILRGGRRLEIEVKTGKGVQSQVQKNFEKMILEFGGVYIVARDITKTIETVKGMV